LFIVLPIALGFLAIAFLLTWMRSHRLRIKDATSKGAYITDYWVVEKKDKTTKATVWQTVWFQKKLTFDKPPQESISIGKKGRKYAVAFRLTSNELAWVKDKTLEESNPKDKDGNNLVDLENIFTKTQREFAAHQYIKAEEENMNKKGWTADKIVSIAMVGSLAMVVICALIFLPDVIKEANVFVDSLGNVAGSMTEAADRFAAIEGCQDAERGQTPPTANPNVVYSNSEKPPTK
jgi:hypothetical protein